jgi:hypothetical protein
MLHIDVCPDCGATASSHPLDPPSYCPYEYGRYEPVPYVPAADYEAAREALERIVRTEPPHAAGARYARAALENLPATDA